MSNVRKSLIAAAAAVHFAFVFSVVTHAHDFMLHHAGFAIVTGLTEYYSAVTFANRNFGFFAPSVTSDWNVSIVARGRNMQPRETFFRASNREMAVKMYSLAGHFAETPDTMNLFARSWAVRVMNEQQAADRVDIVVTQNRIPTMAEYRRGVRITAEPFYRTTFTLRK